MSRTRIHVSLLAGALALLAAPSLALADEAPAAAPAGSHFGDAGQFALHLNEGFVVNASDVVSGPQIQLNYFPIQHLSLGVMVGANWYAMSGVNGGSSSNDFVFRVGPRVGYDIPISDYVSFWPQIGVDFRDTNSSSNAVPPATVGAVTTAGSSSTSTAFGLAIVAPFVVHPTKGFFIGAGPAFYTEFSNSTSNSANGGPGVSTDNSKVTSLGLMATIGGAF